MKLNEALAKLSLKILDRMRREVIERIDFSTQDLQATKKKVSDLEVGLDTTNKNVENLDKEITNMGKTVSDLDENLDQTQQSLKQTNKSVNDLTNNLEETNNNVENIKAGLSDTNKSLSEQGKKIDENSKKITSIGGKKAYLSDRYFVFIGDSYTYGYYPDNSAKKITGYVDLAKARTGFNGNILARGGEGFAKNGTYGKFLTRIKEFSGDKSQVTDVVVLGGYNDHDMSVSEISAGIKEFCNYVASNFPVAKVTIGMVGWSTSASRYYELRKVLSTYTEGACANKCAFIPNLEFVMHNTELFSSDGLHPNAEGHSRLSAALTSWIMGGGVDVAYGYQAVEYTVAGGISMGSTSFYSQLQNEVCSLLHSDCVGISCSVSQSQWNGFHATRMQILTMTGKTNLEGANFTGDVKTSQSSAQVTVASTAQIEGKWYPCTLIIELISSAMFVSILATNESGYLSGKCTSFILPSFQIVAQSMCA